MLGCRAIYHDGWKAVTFHPMVGFAYEGSDPALPFDDDAWELYHVAEDFSETDRPGGRPSPSGCASSSTCGGRRPSATRCCR